MSALNARQQIGKSGEETVARVLTKRGFVIVGRNLYARFGELDIVATREGVIHIIEVKTRTSDLFGGVETALTRRKLLAMQRSWLELRSRECGSVRGRVQYDFAAVTYDIRTEQPTKMQFFWNISMDDLQR